MALVAICASAALFIGGYVLQVLGLLAPVLGLFFGGWLLSCVLEPLVGRLMRTAHTQRSTAVFVAFLFVLLLLGLTYALIAPTLSDQINRSIVGLPTTVEIVTQRLIAGQTLANTWFAQHGVPIQLDVASGSGLGAVMQQLGASTWQANPLAVTMQVVSAFGSFGLMLLLSVFFLAGGPQLAEQVTTAFGTKSSDARFVLTAVHDTFESYARASLLQGLLYGVGVWACLQFLQVDTAPLIGFAAGALLLIPVVGAALAVLLPVIATLIWNPSAVVVIAIALILLEQVVLNVVGPRLMSQRLGLPPLLVFFGVLAGGQLGGFWGAVFGIPTLAALLSCAEHFRTRSRGGPGEPGNG